MKVMYVVEAETIEESYTLNTLDMALGIIGGFSALVWSIFGLSMADYQRFKMESSYIRKFFSIEPKAIGQENDAAWAGGETVQNPVRQKMVEDLCKRVSYDYEYW